jgi:hypothetical protein
VRTAAGSAWNRSWRICPENVRTVCITPWNISSLVSACTGRGEKIARRGPSMTPTWLEAKSTGPVRGTRSAWWTVIR